MLRKLQITNYALIDKAEIDFMPGFSVLTGESGAGKSIMLEALLLVLGSRANFNSIRNGELKCSVEAEFGSISESTIELLRNNQLDVLDSLILRRELTREGRSRAFVNDTPVNLNLMKELGRTLVDLHGQQENLALQTQSYQCRQLDIFCDGASMQALFESKFIHWNSVRKQKEQLIEQCAKFRKDQDYLEFQLEELNEINLEPTLYDSLGEELKALEHSEDIIITLNRLLGLMNDENGINSQLSYSVNESNSLSSITVELREINNRLRSAQIELSDLSLEVERMLNSTEVNPERLNVIRENIDAYNRLFHKHSVKSIEELALLKADYEARLGEIVNQEDELIALEKEEQQVYAELQKIGQQLHKMRAGFIPEFESLLKTQVQKLGMPKAHFKIKLEPLKEPQSNGFDSVEMLFNANGSDHLNPLQAVASGGEIARLMLALKGIQSKSNDSLTMVFDEIDTGVSGEVAKRIGQLMKTLGEKAQIISVTHLPGVAASGDHHLKIYKIEQNNKTLSRVNYLDDQSRIEELAGMFSGNKLNEASLESARNLLTDRN